ncbi:FAD-dependent oxidoreductase [Cupriavidus sp. WKF15]|uniref:NAD(P)/FAD-dependent oxidoreductase n=1 Tax=Cupriavidus sp. WKF15 TaxID=3032282 RepID=UPI0023E246A3|nr:FAD-dependent oxidoreductase [Cupriavidus sp. WKF15]WER50836.1 FAD-dependent oxidoreductase [Cupriavidus sp. WKF15]
MKRIVVVGGGFGGLWSAVGAARKIREAGVEPSNMEVVLVSPGKHHSIRVRNYESDLASTLVPFAEVLDPIGVQHVEGEVIDVNTSRQVVLVRTEREETEISYSKLIIATGSQLARPPIPGLAQYAHDIDTYAGAKRLKEHMGRLAEASPAAGRFTAIVIGAGLTGIELALELPDRLREAARSATGSDSDKVSRVILADRTPRIGEAMGEAQPVIERACEELGVEMWPNFSIEFIGESEVVLTNGERLPASTVVWCGGMRAHPLNRRLPAKFDSLGRIVVDKFMRVGGIKNVFAAGDAATTQIDGDHSSVMSCQHARPMGRFAGHNAASELLDLPMMPLSIDWYTTILDLGAWGAVYTEGWDRRLVAEGAVAKQTKLTINHERIYPPRSGIADEILEAGAPIVQRPPGYGESTGKP